MGFGHHVSAHRLVHHRFVATPEDPNTPRLGESFWRYLPRAWVGKLPRRAEGRGARVARPHDSRTPIGLDRRGASRRRRRACAGRPRRPCRPARPLGLPGTQILLSDYIQHYGLTGAFPCLPGGWSPSARITAGTRPGFSSYLMMNAPSHSEHHLHPDRRLRQAGAGHAMRPTLPRSLPVMAVIATDPAALAQGDGPPRRPRHGRRRRTDRRGTERAAA
jgi:alkane 1-monooxygenase